MPILMEIDSWYFYVLPQNWIWGTLEINPRNLTRYKWSTNSLLKVLMLLLHASVEFKTFMNKINYVWSDLSIDFLFEVNMSWYKYSSIKIEPSYGVSSIYIQPGLWIKYQAK